MRWGDHSVDPIALGWALGSDNLQWIFCHVHPIGKLYARLFVTQKAVLERLARERRLALMPEGPIDPLKICPPDLAHRQAGTDSTWRR